MEYTLKNYHNELSNRNKYQFESTESYQNYIYSAKKFNSFCKEIINKTIKVKDTDNLIILKIFGTYNKNLKYIAYLNRFNSIMFGISELNKSEYEIINTGV